MRVKADRERERPASQQGMRRQNLALVLRTVADRGPVSRAAVASHTGLTRAAVSSLAQELADAGLLAELGPSPSGTVGRPGSALTVPDTGPAGLGLEVGTHHLGACVTDLRGEVRVQAVREAGNAARPPAETLADLAVLAGEAAARATALGLRPVGSVLAVPGLIGDTPGTVEHAPNLDWRRVGLAASWPGDLVPEPENEANLGALAELWAGGGPPDFIHVSAAAGIGAALVTGGRLFRGARGFAGELGHVPVHPEGPRCACGARGCLEQYAGENAVVRAAGLTPAPEDGVRTLAERARARHGPVLAALDSAGAALGTALSGAVNLVDPAGIVLGGAYAELAPWLLPRMRAELAARVTVRPWEPGALAASGLGRRGPLLGAALVTVRRVLDDPARLWSPEPATG